MCKKLFNKEQTIVKSNKRYCFECYKIREEKLKLKMKDWDLLFKYICKKYQINKPTLHMFAQLKKYRAEYQCTDIGMYYTLKYYYDILGNDVIANTGIGIIPYYYDQADKYYNQVFDLQDLADNIEQINDKTITIKTKKQKSNINKKQKLIPIDKLRKEHNNDNS